MTETTPDWDRLYEAHPDLLVAELDRAYRGGSIAYTASDLANDASTTARTFTAAQALALLEDSRPWLNQVELEMPPDSTYPDEPPDLTPQFVWTGEPKRRTGWLLLVHGMNTRGRWQELLAFDIGLWQGKSTPSFVFKYGRIVLGVVLPWQRSRFKERLKNQILMLSKEAAKHKIRGKPDVVAHSFGTWLIGHLLLDELKQKTGTRVGRVILTGSILRPDFPWQELQQAGIVENVLNHYGTKDPVVPLAHWVIWDSGPSGRRGFDLPENDTDAVINVAAPEFGHSEVLSDDDRYASYRKTWRPFLRNPDGHASRDLSITDPKDQWSEAWWPLRGTVLPFVAILLLVALSSWGVAELSLSVASLSSSITDPLRWTARFLGLTALALVGLYGLQKVRCLMKRRNHHTPAPPRPEPGSPG